jgi:hypothetical protein
MRRHVELAKMRRKRECGEKDKKKRWISEEKRKQFNKQFNFLHFTSPSLIH